jgi:dynein assembly factor 3
MDGFGNINWWSFSPALDLNSLYNKKISNVTNKISKNDQEKQQPKELNILLINAGDQSHILKTLSTKPKDLKIRIFIYEKLLELYARDLLLLSIALQHPAKMSMQEKTELYLELYGNLLIREYSANFIIRKSNEFIKCITDLDQMKRTRLGLFNFSLLKFKERDFLEGIFKFWRLKLPAEQKDVDSNFPATRCWDIRLRTYFGTRYDVRKNAFDWDFQMKLVERKNCAIINKRVYQSWRETGVGYELRDSQYDTANKTLASGMVFNDPRSWEKTSRRGYFGDIIIGPYLAYGIKSDNLDFYKKQNENYRFTAWDVAKDNVEKLMTAVLDLSGLDLTKYKKKEEASLSAKITELKLEEIVEESEIEVETTDENKTPPASFDQLESDLEEYFELENVEFNFMPLSSMEDLGQKSKYEHFFDVVYFGNSGTIHMNDKLKSVMKSGESGRSLVVFETTKYMIELKNEQIAALSDKVREIAAHNGLTDVTDYLKEGAGGDVNQANGRKDADGKELVGQGEPHDHLVFLT